MHPAHHVQPSRVDCARTTTAIIHRYLPNQQSPCNPHASQIIKYLQSAGTTTNLKASTKKGSRSFLFVSSSYYEAAGAEASAGAEAAGAEASAGAEAAGAEASVAGAEAAGAEASTAGAEAAVAAASSFFWQPTIATVEAIAAAIASFLSCIASLSQKKKGDSKTKS